MLFSKKEKITAIKLYSIGDEQEKINRPELVDCLLELFETKFYELPKNYVIHGPYGVRKGGAVGIKSFKNKLDAKGHEKYYALSGDTEGRLGFGVSFESKLSDTTYSEFIVWYKANAFDVSFSDVVKMVVPAFSACSGFEIETNDSFDIFTESKIKKGLLGGMSIKVSYEHLDWVNDFKNGGLRGVFKKNLLSQKQLENALKLKLNLEYEKYENLFFVEENV